MAAFLGASGLSVVVGRAQGPEAVGLSIHWLLAQSHARLANLLLISAAARVCRGLQGLQGCTVLQSTAGICCSRVFEVVGILREKKLLHSLEGLWISESVTSAAQLPTLHP